MISPKDLEVSVDPDPKERSSLVLRGPETPKLWDDVALQKLWLATQKREWRSVALLGTAPSVDTLGIGELFAKLVWWYRGQRSCIFDLRDLSLRLIDYHLH